MESSQKHAYALGPEEASFFAGHEEALQLYAAFMQQAKDALPQFSIRVQKTQITLSNRHAFACVSFLAVRRKALMPQSSITVTFGLDHPLASARIDAQAESYPGRWTHHLLISDAEELDSELIAWLHKAYELSARKRRGAPDGKGRQPARGSS